MDQKQIFVFDFDGTLADSNELEKVTMVETIRLFQDKDFRADSIFAYFGPTEDGILRKIIAPERQEEAVNYFFDCYRKKQEDLLKTFDGIDTILSLLKENGKTLYLLTGRSETTLKMSLERLGIASFFSGFYTGSLEGVNKPENMQRLLSEHHLQHKDVVYVGDTLADIQSMKKAKVDLISAGYSHSGDYVQELEKNNPGNVARTIKELREKIEKLL